MNDIKVLKFYADWCAPCKILSKNLSDKDYIQEVNIEHDHETALKYHVRKIPTLVFFKNDEEKHRTTGIITKYEFEMIIDELTTSDKEISQIKVIGAEIVAHLKENTILKEDNNGNSSKI
jgi:thioredoxin 1